MRSASVIRHDIAGFDRGKQRRTCDGATEPECRNAVRGRESASGAELHNGEGSGSGALQSGITGCLTAIRHPERLDRASPVARTVRDHGGGPCTSAERVRRTSGLRRIRSGSRRIRLAVSGPDPIRSGYPCSVGVLRRALQRSQNSTDRRRRSGRHRWRRQRSCLTQARRHLHIGIKPGVWADHGRTRE